MVTWNLLGYGQARLKGPVPNECNRSPCCADVSIRAGLPERNTAGQPELFTYFPEQIRQGLADVRGVRLEPEHLSQFLHRFVILSLLHQGDGEVAVGAR